MSKLQKIYDISPVWIQECFINVYGIKAYLQRYTGSYTKLKKYYRNKDYSDYSTQLEDQNKLLQSFLAYCKDKCAFYRDILTRYDVSDWTVRDLTLLPFVDKEILRSHMSEFISAKGHKTNTGGTTGKSLNVVFTKEDFKRRMAYLDAFKERHGVKLGMRVVRFSGKNLIPTSKEAKSIKKFWRTNWIIKQRLYSTFHMNETTLSYYVENLNKFKPVSFDGFIASIYELANYIEKNNLKIEFQLKAIFPTAETVLDHHREVIERVFNCPIRDQYASSEGAPFVVECVKGNKHYCMDTGVIEVIGDNPNCGEIAVTSFTTHGTPLIRYLIGDMMEFSDQKCECGSSHPIVKQIIGRNTDYLYSKERGKIFSANMSNVIKYLPNSVINIQYIQKSEDFIEINVVFQQDLFRGEHTDLILSEMQNRLGVNMKFKINILNEIPRASSGKFRFIINEAKIN